jgi:hypothetical protein
MHPRTEAKLSAAETAGGLLAAMSYTVALKRETAKLKPQISQLLARNKGVLLAIGTSKVGNYEVSMTNLEYISIAGAGDQPEPIAGRFLQQGTLTRAPRGTPQETIFLWVMRRNDLAHYFRRPPGYYGSIKNPLKVGEFESL